MKTIEITGFNSYLGFRIIFITKFSVPFHFHLAERVIHPYHLDRMLCFEEIIILVDRKLSVHAFYRSLCDLDLFQRMLLADQISFLQRSGFFDAFGEQLRPALLTRADAWPSYT